jgi:hypothetical protein
MTVFNPLRANRPVATASATKGISNTAQKHGSNSTARTNNGIDTPVENCDFCNPLKMTGYTIYFALRIMSLWPIDVLLKEVMHGVESVQTIASLQVILRKSSEGKKGSFRLKQVLKSIVFSLEKARPHFVPSA